MLLTYEPVAAGRHVNIDLDRAAGVINTTARRRGSRSASAGMTIAAATTCDTRQRDLGSSVGVGRHDRPERQDREHDGCHDERPGRTLRPPRERVRDTDANRRPEQRDEAEAENRNLVTVDFERDVDYVGAECDGDGRHCGGDRSTPVRHSGRAWVGAEPVVGGSVVVDAIRVPPPVRHFSVDSHRRTSSSLKVKSWRLWRTA